MVKKKGHVMTQTGGKVGVGSMLAVLAVLLTTQNALAASLGIPLDGFIGTFETFVVGLGLAVGLVVYGIVRRRLGEGVFERVDAPPVESLPETHFSSILVPMKLGPIGEEMVATAVKLAQESGASVWALHVIRVPMDRPIDDEIVDVLHPALAHRLGDNRKAVDHSGLLLHDPRPPPRVGRHRRLGGYVSVAEVLGNGARHQLLNLRRQLDHRGSLTRRRFSPCEEASRRFAAADLTF